MFSTRVPSDLNANRLTEVVRARRRSGAPVIDLTTTNPTVVGIPYPERLLDGLSSREAYSYEPRPFGDQRARAAVAADYGRRGIDVEVRQIVLTASTSEAYSLLFKLLCAPEGDAVLVPVPSYPLFDHLTRLDGVERREYELEFHGRWSVSEAAVDHAWTERVRAVLAVSPNNPTGSILSDAELAALDRRCASRDAALIVDEVFADYPLAVDRPRATYAFESLCFRLGGLSKSAGLPQVKLGWIAVDGPASLVEAALDRLELICDSYLSVSTPVQVAAPALIEQSATVRTAILERVRANDATLRQLAAPYPSIEVPAVEGGWSAVVRVPATHGEEWLVTTLVERDGVIVHPGYFFDFPHEAFIVVSLLPPPDEFASGVAMLMERACE
jgi:alanine-synthesizing transaminase